MMMENETRLDSKVMLEELRAKEHRLQIPIIVYLILISMFGTVGNALVLYTYKRKYSPSNCRTFIICLSIMDLISCVIVIPVEIWFLFMEFDFHILWLCKLSVFLNAWPTLTSGFLLVCIAVDRYRKVCRPFQWQLSGEVAVAMCVITAVMGVAFSWMSPVIYGIQSSQHPVYENITISQCVETDAMKATAFPLINNISFALLFLSSLTAIIVMYCMIALRVKRHVKRKQTLMNKHRTLLKDTPEASEMTIMSGKVVLENRLKGSVDDLETSEDLFYSSDVLKSKGTASGSNSQTYLPVVCSIDAEEDQSQNRHSLLSRLFSTASSIVSRSTLSRSSNNRTRTSQQRKSKQERVNRTALIMFQISLAFIISYLPLLCLLLIRTADSTFVQSLSDGGRATYKFFLRSYYLNCAINPVIYGLWDSRFRKSCKQLFCRLCR